MTRTTPERIADELMAPAAESALWTYDQVRELLIKAVTMSSRPYRTVPEFRKEDGVPGEPRPNILEFDQNGWQVDLRDDGMRIIGRSPAGKHLALFNVLTITGAGVPGKPALTENTEGDQHLLVTAAPN